MKQVSDRMAKARRLYNQMRVPWLLKNPECAVFRNKLASQVHHARGRIGTLLIDVRFWRAVSMEGHEWIGRNPRLARSRGLLCEHGLWNSPPRDAESERLKDLLR